MIDHQTVQRIKDAANIVEVVSEFVTLKRAGANYKGLCPFHNERTPSFVVSPARNTCHCFGCGKGGNPVGFIMEHEQMTYPEALRWLANKYHIEIKERELSDEERQEQSRRESMFIFNEWTAKYFEDTLHNTPDGAAVGMPYLRKRGFRDDIIRKFRIGYDGTDRHALARKARAAGYRDEFIVGAGSCYKTEQGELIDRFAGRVVFPWISLSGREVGFTARVLSTATKGISQKYVNSPATEIYQKDHELFGIWQAKKAIAREGRVYMVEGQADVMAMHQCGLENTVANSGTALSTHQIRILHRLANSITLIYDGDAAGIHAALRGADMVLGEGMNLKMLLLPKGQDPDEFARTHSADEFKKYIEEHQTDFIEYKTQLLYQDERDPQKRSEAVNSIVASISFIPNQILRATYLHDCAVRMGYDERVLINEMNKIIRDRKGAEARAMGQRPTMATQQPLAEAPPVEGPDPSEPPLGYAQGTVQPERGTQPTPPAQPMATASKVERMLMQMVVRHGDRVIYNNVEVEDGSLINLTLARFVSYNMEADGLSFKLPLYNRMLQEAVAKSADPTFKAEPFFVQHNDIEMSRLANELANERYHLSDSKQAPPLNEADRKQREEEATEALRQQVTHLLLDFRMDYVERRLKVLQQQIGQVADNMEQLQKTMAEFRDMQEIRNQLAKKLGNNIIV